jgi:hypothetical protein
MAPVIPVSQQALLKRVNRAMSASMRIHKTKPGTLARERLGTYYARGGDADLTHVDLSLLARQLGVLADDEQLDEGE